MRKKITLILLAAMIAFSMVSCKAKDYLTGEGMPNKEWDLIEDSAENTVVSLYITEQDDDMKSWLSSQLCKKLLEKHNIELNVKMLEFSDIITLLKNDILNEVTTGQIDLMILKDDEFSVLKGREYLYAKIAGKIPNTEEYINKLDTEVKSEHGNSLDGYSVPFSRNQFVLMFDEDELESYPHNTEELIEFVKDNKNSFTYPNPTSDEVGAEFVRTVIYEIVGEEKISELMNPDLSISEAGLYDIIKPALDYLVELDEYLLKNGDDYFTRISDVDKLFLDGELYFSMSDDFAYAETGIKNETYPDGARSFIFESGTIGDTKYLGVPLNASNKSGALVVINEMMSLEMQLSKYNPKNWGALPIIDLNLLSESEAEKFKKVSVKRNTVRVEELFKARFSELPVIIRTRINNLWNEHVNVGK